MKQNSIWMGFEIQTSHGPILQPKAIKPWKDHQFKANKPESPFHYKADALAGLSLLILNESFKNPFSLKSVQLPFAQQCWLLFEPMHEMRLRGQGRLSELRSHNKPEQNPFVQKFESHFSENLAQSFSPHGLDLGVLSKLVHWIDQLETQTQQPLIYNFNLEFSRRTTAQILYLHSLLFSLRTLVAMDFNARAQDVTFEALKVDSISDYLPRSEYISNDAILYLRLLKAKGQMPENCFKDLTKSFSQFTHHAVCLVENLPQNFIKSIAQKNLEHVLYVSQMDWLMATDAGLLFRVREELYGILDGYEKIFWPEHETSPNQSAHKLSVNCEITEADLPTRAAA